MDIILTGASRGIGRALAEALSPDAFRLHVLARDRAALEALAAARGAETSVHVADFSRLDDAERAGREVAGALRDSRDAILIHNAGIWPAKRELTREGLERAYVVNCVAPLVFQRPLLEAHAVSRVLVIGAGLMVKGRFDREQTPVGADFSWFRTYCSTKLAFAVAMRDVARDERALDVAVVHPGVVRTDLGARPGLLGWLASRVKRRWESPETCAARLRSMIERAVTNRARWSPPGEARWFVPASDTPTSAAPNVSAALADTPWPAVVLESAPVVRQALSRWVPSSPTRAIAIRSVVG